MTDTKISTDATSETPDIDDPMGVKVTRHCVGVQQPATPPYNREVCIKVYGDNPGADAARKHYDKQIELEKKKIAKDEAFLDKSGDRLDKLGDRVTYNCNPGDAAAVKKAADDIPCKKGDYVSGICKIGENVSGFQKRTVIANAENNLKKDKDHYSKQEREDVPIIRKVYEREIGCAIPVEPRGP